MAYEERLNEKERETQDRLIREHQKHTEEKEKIKKEKMDGDREDQLENRARRGECTNVCLNGEEERSKEQTNELGKIQRDRKRVEILMAGMASGYVADAHAKTLVGLGNAILQVMESLGRKRGPDSGGEAPGKRRRLEEPGSWPGLLKMTSEEVRDAVLEKEGTGDVDTNP